MGPPPAANLRSSTPTPDFKVEPERATAPYDFGARCVSAWAPRVYSSSVPRTSLVFGFTRCLCACKARHLDVGEVIVFAIISGPSELVIKVRSLRRQSVAAIVCLVVALTFPCSWGSVVIMC